MHRLNTLFIGQVFHDLPQVASTNEYAVSLLSKSKPPEGTVISTRRQYAGRGQIGSKWESEADKNITLSIILYPDFLPVQRQFLLNQAISLAVFDFISNQIPGGVKIKWPNDIYINDRKAAGILLQNTLSNNRLRSSVAGIGINVNQTTFLTNPPNPTSLKLETGNFFNLDNLVNELCHCVEARYLKLKSGNLVPLHHDYLDALYRYQSEANFERNDGTIFQGTITGVEESGRLKMLVQGQEEVFDLKEVRFVID